MTAEQRLALVAPGGDQVTVTLPDTAPVSSVAAAVRFAGGSYGTGFQIGPRGYHDFACTHVAPATTTDRFLVHGREVVVAEARDGESSVATLMGSYHELMTVYAGPAPRRERVFALFDSLRVDDRVPGMVVAPRAETLLGTMSEHVVVVVRDFGTVSIPGPRQARDHVPAHAGAPTRHGEVWKAALPGAEGSTRPVDHAYVLGCARGVAEVQLADSPHRTDRERLDWLDGIAVAWSAA
ncbi:hypothetical protein [Saccharothrix longispora]|uniref:hypothetical protein n=1 Tax=Saccharothrix longispora TaxID=33920 RepID=UPI0028FD32F8|nr:hypothetical protein [Saccharothrix longispora]MBY8849841.1 hypothetical protein [Saccharothrix sp. MB29]MDU0288603.1 hypothetical protein [Saccharothrix longispora]